jgi:hypothetical protein
VFFGDKDQWLPRWEVAQAKWKSVGNQATDLYIAHGVGHSFYERAPWESLTLIAADQFLVKHGLLTGEPTKTAPASGEKLILANEKITPANEK